MTRQPPFELKVAAEGKEFKYKTSTKKEIRMAYRACHRLLKKGNYSARESILKQLYQWQEVTEQGRFSHRSLNTKEIEKMAQSKSAVVGAHSHTHSCLARLSYQEQMDEIKKSKTILENKISRKITHFAYPFGGQSDFNDDTVRIVKELGFEMVFANVYGQAHKWTDNFRVPRILVRNWDFDAFQKKLEQFFKF